MERLMMKLTMIDFQFLVFPKGECDGKHSPRQQQLYISF